MNRTVQVSFRAVTALSYDIRKCSGQIGPGIISNHEVVGSQSALGWPEGWPNFGRPARRRPGRPKLARPPMSCGLLELAEFLL